MADTLALESGVLKGSDAGSGNTGKSKKAEKVLKYAEARSKARRLIMEGNISQAISVLNDEDTEILEHNWKLCFLLQKQMLIESLFLSNEQQQIESKTLIHDALNFAKEQLLPRVRDHPQVLRGELEDIMGIFLFIGDGSNGMTPKILLDKLRSAFPMVAQLVSPTQRQYLADQVNLAMLSHLENFNEVYDEPKLSRMVKSVFLLEENNTQQENGQRTQNNSDIYPSRIIWQAAPKNPNLDLSA